MEKSADKERLKALFDHFKIGYTETGNNIECYQGKEKIKGYSMFYTVFKFSQEGQFLEMGAYE